MQMRSSITGTYITHASAAFLITDSCFRSLLATLLPVILLCLITLPAQYTDFYAFDCDAKRQSRQLRKRSRQGVIFDLQLS